MTMVDRLASFVARARCDDIPASLRLSLEIRLLDALGCALGALDGDPPGRVRRFVAAFSPTGPCTLVGGGCAAPDRAALLNGALVRYLDFNDSYLAPRETCHPSDNLAAVLAAAELAHADGATLLAALAVAYQVQCRLSDVAPVRDRGFDHTTHLAYSAAAGAARALGLDAATTTNAVAISGTALNALRVTRTGVLSHWKGLAAPFAASSALEATLLARQGITGPAAVFEGNKGFVESLSGPFAIDWEHEGFDRIGDTIVKLYNAEVHSQSALQAVMDIRSQPGFSADRVARVDVDIFEVAHRIIGGGEEGDKRHVVTKEDADHSLPYLIAVALLDGDVMPPQFAPERIRRRDVQALLSRVQVRPDPAFSRRFPAEMPCRVTVTFTDGRTISVERDDYPGFRTRPIGWEEAMGKFVALASPHVSPALATEIADRVLHLEQVKSVAELMALLGRAARGPQASRAA